MGSLRPFDNGYALCIKFYIRGWHSFEIIFLQTSFYSFICRICGISPFRLLPSGLAMRHIFRSFLLAQLRFFDAHGVDRTCVHHRIRHYLAFSFISVFYLHPLWQAQAVVWDLFSQILSAWSVRNGLFLRLWRRRLACPAVHSVFRSDHFSGSLLVYTPLHFQQRENGTAWLYRLQRRIFIGRNDRLLLHFTLSGDADRLLREGSRIHVGFSWCLRKIPD